MTARGDDGLVAPTASGEPAPRDRTHGVASVRAAMGRVRDGSAVFLAVVGPPGAGRTAFLATVAGLAAGEGFAVRHGRGVGTRRDPRPTGLLGPPGPGAHSGPPEVYLLDDLHEADRESLAGLARWCDGPRTVPLLVVAAFRRGDPRTERPCVHDLLAAADHVISVAPLGRAGVRALLGERGASLTGTQLSAWTHATGGNPALLVSLLDRVKASRPVAPAHLLDAARARPAPEGLRSRVAEVMNSQPESARRLAHCAVILGDTGDGAVLARLSGLDPAQLAEGRRALLRLGWDVDHREPPVLWDCVSEIAEETLPPACRAALHSRAVELLHGSGAPPERIVPHLLEIGPGEWASTAAVLWDAAEDLLRRGSVDLAIRCLRRALREFPPDSAQRGTFLAALSAAEQGVDTSAALRHAVQANQLLTSVRERAEVVAGVPLTLFLTAPQTTSVLASAGGPQALRDAGTDTEDLALRLEARVRLGTMAAPEAPRDAVGRLRTLVRGPGSAAERELSSALVFAGTLGGRLPRAEAAGLVRRLLDQELPQEASAHGAPALLIAAGTATGVDGPVSRWLGSALVAARERGDEALAARLLSWRAYGALHAGRLADAWADASDACAVAPGPLTDDDWPAVVGLTSVALETRDTQLSGRLGALLEERQGAGISLAGLAGRALRAHAAPVTELPLLLDELLKAARLAEEKAWSSRALFPVDLWSVAPLLRAGRKEDALRLLSRACEAARTAGSQAEVGRTLRLWGTVVGGAYSLSLLAESVSVLRETSNTLELGRALTAYGSRLRAAGRPGSAELFAEADRIADAAGESVLWCWTGTLRGEPRHAVPPGGRGLSDTERRVAALVVLGHTNQETAAALGVTRRAVEKTLTRVYRRMDVEGRSGLVPVVRRMAGRAAFAAGMLSERL